MVTGVRYGEPHERVVRLEQIPRPDLALLAVDLGGDVLRGAERYDRERRDVQVGGFQSGFCAMA
jgi:hypothetical protein